MIAQVIAAAVLMATAGAGADLGAHPFHVTIAEVDFNDEAKTLEIAIRIYNPRDLEQAIERREQQKVDLERTEDVDAMILDYLADSLIVERPDGEPAPLAWVGKEVSLKTAWLYVEAPLPDGLDGATFTNTLLFEIESDQVNTMVFGRGRDRVSLQFNKDSPSQTFRRPGAGS